MNIKKQWAVTVGAASLALLAGALLLAGCATGAERSPTALEQRLFTIQTNYVPTVHVVTNTIVVTQAVQTVITNVVVQPPLPGATVPIFVTNVIPQITEYLSTNYVQATQSVTVPVYSYMPGTNATAIADGAETIGSLFGVGSIAKIAVGGLFGLWGLLRSSKANKTAAVLVQGTQVAREMLSRTPQGQALDQKLVTFLIQHQAEAGVVQHVTELVRDHVSDVSAKNVADQLLEELAAGRAVPKGVEG